MSSCYAPSRNMEHIPGVGLASLYYEQKFCDNLWGPFSKDLVTTSNNMDKYFESIKLGGKCYTIRLVTTFPDSCNTCECKTGSLVVIQVKNITKIKQKFYSLGFKDYGDSFKLPHNN